MREYPKLSSTLEVLSDNLLYVQINIYDVSELTTFLSIKEVLDRKYITDASIAQALVAGELDLTDDIVVEHIYQLGAYQEVYVTPVDDPKTPEDESIPEVAEEKADKENTKDAQEQEQSGGDHNDFNNISFTLDGEEIIYQGSPKAKAKNALKALNIQTPVYKDGEELDLSHLKASDLTGLELVTVLGV